ncbi:hypothetical protein [Saccharopolyspora sp. NPDC050642]|uniref:hypothetical protein n=1 Tax=Saccharopolyspora sp. NPDC050642 TaxID=3157099 RepID=UPI0033E7F4A1
MIAALSSRIRVRWLLAILILVWIAAMGAIGAGWLSNRLTARGAPRRISRGFLAGSLVVLAGVSMFAFTVLPTGVPQMVFITLAFSCNSAAYAVAFTAVADVVHPRTRSFVLGFLVAFYSMAGVIAPLVLGYFVGNAANSATGYGYGFAFTGILMAVGGAASTFLVRPEVELLAGLGYSDAVIDELTSAGVVRSAR